MGGWKTKACLWMVLSSFLLLARVECHSPDPDSGGHAGLDPLIKLKSSSNDEYQVQVIPNPSQHGPTPEIKEKLVSLAGTKRTLKLLPVTGDTILSTGDLLHALEEQRQGDAVLFVTLDDVAFALFGKLFSKATVTPTDLGVGNGVSAAEMKPLLIGALLDLDLSVMYMDPSHNVWSWSDEPISTFSHEFDAWILRTSGASHPQRSMLRGATSIPEESSSLLFVNPTKGSRMLVSHWSENVRSVARQGGLGRGTEEVGVLEELNRAVMQLKTSSLSLKFISRRVARRQGGIASNVKDVPLVIRTSADESN